MAEILDFVRERNPLVQIVINVAALETLSVVGNYLKEKNLEVIFQIYKDDAANASERGKNERKKNHSRRG